jgi:hypothetical protein
MRPFLHHRLQKLERLLEHSNAALAKFNDQDLDLPIALTGFVDEAIAVYHSLGLASGENHLLSLKAQHVSARRGIDPSTLERVTSHRREMERGVALRVLQQSAQQLRADFAQDRQAALLARENLIPLALTALKKGLIAPGTVEQPALNDLWRSLLSDPETQDAARHVAMTVNVVDILLLLGDLIAAAG